MALSLSHDNMALIEPVGRSSPGPLDRRPDLTRLRALNRNAPYLRKWVILGALIGLISGLGAVLFFWALDLATRFFLGTLAGFTPASPAGEGGAPIVDIGRRWALPLIVAAGGLISGIIVFRFAPEAEGHGTDAAIAAIHHGPRGIRSRIPAVKLVASAITIGSGGSGGREGPTAQIGAGFGSYLARLLDLDARDARIAVSCRHGRRDRRDLPCATGWGRPRRPRSHSATMSTRRRSYPPSSPRSSLVFGTFVGFAPIFGRVAGLGFTDPRQLVYYALLGLAAGLVGRLYIASFYGFTDWFRGLSVPRYIRPALGGFAVGCIGIVLPGVLGTGYGWVQAGFDRTALLGLPLWVLLVLPFAKILATSLSIGSGGSGGIFGPGHGRRGPARRRDLAILEPIAPGVPIDPRHS